MSEEEMQKKFGTILMTKYAETGTSNTLAELWACEKNE